MAGDVLPSGIVTFVFTDIEGSTRLLEGYPDSYGSILERHNRLLGDTFRSHGGVIFGTEGDAMFVAFERPTEAMEAALAAQLAVEGGSWPGGAEVRVRMGIHTGEAAIAGGTYIGMAVHIAARVSAAGHGGQVLVTDLTHDLGLAPDSIDLGSHELKDVGSFGIRQLTHPDLPRDFPVLRTVSSMPNNLPASVDEFVGRSALLADVLASLDLGRIVTLTGSGGSGKTRLALEVGRAALGSYRDGVWFVGLIVADGVDRIVPLVAAALRLSERGDEPLETTLEHWLCERDTLLILDNCEQVVAGIGAFAIGFLEKCPSLRLLVTSREVLGVRGERTIATLPLAASEDAAEGGTLDAVELFLVRAAAAVPNFDRNAVDLGLVAQTCARLDGLPLAIELAAARLRALSLAQLASRLDDRFRLLAGGAGSDLPGHRTLEAVVAWSYDLLSDPERQLFRRLAIFPAQFSLEAAESTIVGGGIDEADVLDLLTRLVEKSLVATVGATDPVGYQLLETLRQYGFDRLVDHDEVQRWRDALLRWAMTRVDDVERSLRRPEQDLAIRSVTEDAVTLRAAMDWAMERDDDLSALRIASAVPLGPSSERRRLITALLERLGPDLDPWAAACAYSALGNMANEQGSWAAATEASSRAAEHFHLVGAARHVAWTKYFSAHAAWGAGDRAAADSFLEAAIDGFRSELDDMGLGSALWVSSLRATDLDEAERLAGEADELLRLGGTPTGIAHNVEGRGVIAFDRGEMARAADLVGEALAVFSDYGNLGCVAHALESAAVIVGAVGQAEAATELLGAAEELRHEGGLGHRPWEIRARLGSLEDRMPPLPIEVAEAALSAGRQHSPGSAALRADDLLKAVRAKLGAGATDDE